MNLPKKCRFDAFPRPKSACLEAEREVFLLFAPQYNAFRSRGGSRNAKAIARS